MPDEIVGGGAVASVDPIRDAVANAVEESAGLFEESPVDAGETPVPEPATEPATEPVADATATPPADAPAATPKPKTEDEELAEIEAKLLAENPSMQRGTISRSRHQAMLTRRANEHKVAVEQAVAAERQKYAQFEAPETQERLQGAVIFEQRPDVAWERVITQDPRYVALINAHVEKVIQERGLAAAPAANKAEASPAPNARPEPDVLMADGTLGYSPEAQLQLVAYEVAQRTAAIEAKFEEKLKAIDGDLAPAREVKAANEILAKSYETQGTLLREAHIAWPGFSGLKDEIRAELAKKGNERMGLRAAYDAVRERKFAEVNSKLTDQKTLEAQVRARLVKETNEAAAAAGRTPRPGLPAATVQKDGFASDPIRDAVARAASTLR